MTVFVDPAMRKRWTWRERLLFALGILVLIIQLAQLLVALRKEKATPPSEATTSPQTASSGRFENPLAPQGEKG